jgi:hypothetical protein
VAESVAIVEVGGENDNNGSEGSGVCGGSVDGTGRRMREGYCDDTTANCENTARIGSRFRLSPFVRVNERNVV